MFTTRSIPSFVVSQPKLSSSPTCRFEKTQVGEQLLRVRPCAALHRLDLDDDAILDEKVGAERSLLFQAVVRNSDEALTFHA